MIQIMSHPLSSIFDRSPLLHLKHGQRLFHTGQTVQRVFLVTQGQVQLQRHTPQGQALILQNASFDTILAEASAYSTHYHCDAIALTASTVKFVNQTTFLQAIDQSSALARQWASLLARSVQTARVRAEIRSLPTVAARLDVWLAEGNELPSKGHWQTVAAELSVTREALYRELARRRKPDSSIGS